MFCVFDVLYMWYFVMRCYDRFDSLYLMFWYFNVLTFDVLIFSELMLFYCILIFVLNIIWKIKIIMSLVWGFILTCWSTEVKCFLCLNVKPLLLLHKLWNKISMLSLSVELCEDALISYVLICSFLLFIMQLQWFSCKVQLITILSSNMEKDSILHIIIIYTIIIIKVESCEVYL